MVKRSRTRLVTGDCCRTKQMPTVQLSALVRFVSHITVWGQSAKIAHVLSRTRLQGSVASGPLTCGLGPTAFCVRNKHVETTAPSILHAQGPRGDLQLHSTAHLHSLQNAVCVSCARTARASIFAPPPFARTAAARLRKQLAPAEEHN